MSRRSSVSLILVTLLGSSVQMPSGPLNTFQEDQDANLRQVELVRLNSDALPSNLKEINYVAVLDDNRTESREDNNNDLVEYPIAETFIPNQPDLSDGIITSLFDAAEDFVPGTKDVGIDHWIHKRQIEDLEGLDYNLDLISDSEKTFNPYYSYFVGRKRIRPLPAFIG